MGECKSIKKNRKKNKRVKSEMQKRDSIGFRPWESASKELIGE